MADLTLPLSVEFETTAESYHTLSEILSPGTSREGIRWRYLSSAAYLIGANGLGIYAAVQAQMAFAMVMLGMCLVLVLIRLVKSYHLTRKNFEQNFAMRAGRHVRMELADSGISFHEPGLESAFRWSAMKSCLVRRRVLFVEASSGVWLVIPGDTLLPAFATIEAIHQILLEHGVAKRTQK